jgi:polyphosphate kinase 2 (PPK2 family)
MHGFFVIYYRIHYSEYFRAKAHNFFNEKQFLFFFNEVPNAFILIIIIFYGIIFVKFQ